MAHLAEPVGWPGEHFVRALSGLVKTIHKIGSDQLV
jgi:hypothetical protein